jgi:hypothetical protein
MAGTCGRRRSEDEGMERRGEGRGGRKKSQLESLRKVKGEKMERQEARRTLVGGSESGHDANVGLDDALPQQGNILDELKRRLQQSESAKRISLEARASTEEQKHHRLTGSGLICPACSSTAIVVSKYGLKFGPIANAISPKQLKIGGFTDRCNISD